MAAKASEQDGESPRQPGTQRVWLTDWRPATLKNRLTGLRLAGFHAAHACGDWVGGFYRTGRAAIDCNCDCQSGG